MGKRWVDGQRRESTKRHKFNETFGAAFVSGDGMVSRHLKTSHHMATEHSREHLPQAAVRPDHLRPLPGAGRGRTIEAAAPNANFWTPLQEDHGEEGEWEMQQEEESLQILCDLARSNSSPCGPTLPTAVSLHGSRGYYYYSIVNDGRLHLFKYP